MQRSRASTKNTPTVTNSRIGELKAEFDTGVTMDIPVTRLVPGMVKTERFNLLGKLRPVSDSGIKLLVASSEKTGWIRERLTIDAIPLLWFEKAASLVCNNFLVNQSGYR